MAKKFKFDERCAEEIKKYQECIDSKACLSKPIDEYKKILDYNDKEFHEILGDEYGETLDKINSLKKSFTDKECTAFKALWAYDYFSTRLKDNKEIKYAPLMNIIKQKCFCFDKNEPQENYICRLIGLWEEEAEKGNKQDFIRVLTILRVKDKKASRKNRESCLSKVKKYAKLKSEEATRNREKNDESVDDKNKHEEDIELCFDFLYYKVFPDVDFWKVYCDDKKLYKHWLSFHIDKLLNSQQGDLNQNVEDRDKLLQKITGNAKSEYIYWTASDDNSKFYETNFKRYGFVRCFITLYDHVFDKCELLRWYIDEKASTHYEKYLSWEKRISIDINKSFKNWMNPGNYQNIIHSILKEILIVILENSRKCKEEVARIDRERMLCISNSNSNERIWCTDLRCIGNRTESDEKMKTYFDPVYELKISTGSYQYIKRIISGKKVRPSSFEVMVREVCDLEEELPFFECYMIEKRTGIYSSWELYNIFFEVLDLAAKGKDVEKYENLIEQIKTLAKAVNGIHNLELRVWMIHQVGRIVSDVMGDTSCDIFDAIAIITAFIEKEVIQFQEKYDLLFCALLYLFKNENDWKDIMWMRNFRTEEVVSMLENIKQLKCNSAELSYMQLKFNVLCKAESKREPYKWFREIWKSFIALSE